MRCLECGSEAVTERPERTAQGYRRFRCRTCGKQFNERSGTVLNRTQYPSDVIAPATWSSKGPAWEPSSTSLVVSAVATIWPVSASTPRCRCYGAGGEEMAPSSLDQ